MENCPETKKKIIKTEKHSCLSFIFTWTPSIKNFNVEKLSIISSFYEQVKQGYEIEL